MSIFGRPERLPVRYDEKVGIYRDCKWCGGRGCVYCPGEAEAEYKRQFPDGPKPIATFDMTTKKGIAKAKKAIGAKAINKAFGPGGGGVDEIIKNCEESK